MTVDNEETRPLTRDDPQSRASQDGSRDSLSSVSTTSLVLEGLNDHKPSAPSMPNGYKDDPQAGPKLEPFDIEDHSHHGPRAVDKKARRIFWALAIVGLVGWLVALGVFGSSICL